MRKFESSQKYESRAHSADSSKAYNKLRAFICKLVALSCTWANDFDDYWLRWQARLKQKHKVNLLQPSVEIVVFS